MKLNNLIVAKLKASYQERGHPVPPQLISKQGAPPFTLLVSTVQTQVKKLEGLLDANNKSHAVEVSVDAFAKWRLLYEKPQGSDNPQQSSAQTPLPSPSRRSRRLSESGSPSPSRKSPRVR